MKACIFCHLCVSTCLHKLIKFTFCYINWLPLFSFSLVSPPGLLGNFSLWSCKLEVAATWGCLVQSGEHSQTDSTMEIKCSFFFSLTTLILFVISLNLPVYHVVFFYLHLISFLKKCIHFYHPSPSPSSLPLLGVKGFSDLLIKEFRDIKINGFTNLGIFRDIKSFKNLGK